jgi:anthranilate synthase
VLESYAALTNKVPKAAPTAGGAAASTPSYTTQGGVVVHRTETSEDGLAEVEKLVDSLDQHKGMLMMSTFEYPGRYTKWKVGFVDPPLQITTRQLSCSIKALNARGKVLHAAIIDWLSTRKDSFVEKMSTSGDETTIEIKKATGKFTEEERSRQPSVFSLVREIVACFHTEKVSIDGFRVQGLGYRMIVACFHTEEVSAYTHHFHTKNTCQEVAIF